MCILKDKIEINLKNIKCEPLDKSCLPQDDWRYRFPVNTEMNLRVP
jgi:hypothetical protein